MAAFAPPVLVGAGTAAFESTSGASFSPSLPAGLQAGDVLLLHFTHTGSLGALSAPDGWTQLVVQDVATVMRSELWWKRAGASETSPSLTLVSNAVTTVRGARIYAVRGCPKEGDPFAGWNTMASPTPTASVAVLAGPVARGGELALALVAYAADPLAASTITGWTQPAGAVQGYSMDPWSGSFVVDSADPDVPSGGPAGPGAALIHEYQTAQASGGTLPGGSMTVSGGSFSPAPYASLTLSLFSAPTAALRVRIRGRVVSSRGAPSAVRLRSRGAAVAARAAVAVASARTIFSALVQSARAASSALLGQARSRGRALGRKGTLGAVRPQVALRGEVVSQRTQYTLGAGSPWVSLRVQTTAVSRIDAGPLPIRPPTPIDLGEIYRGDTVKLPVWRVFARNGLPVDLSGMTLRFTAKLDLGESDEAPTTINASTENGTIAILDPPRDGRYRVTIASDETSDLEIDGAFRFDVQLEVETPAISIHTVQHGRLLVNRDVTRSTV